MDHLKLVRIQIYLAAILLSGGFLKCSEKTMSKDIAIAEEEVYQDWNSLVVTASAYNSLQSQGVGNPNITAWGDSLVPGMKSIAVSRDLIAKGLGYKTKVRIQGLEGLYIVNDKMHPRWKNKIDIYMGIDRNKALEWGRRKVEICFPVKE